MKLTHMMGSLKIHFNKFNKFLHFDHFQHFDQFHHYLNFTIPLSSH